MLLQRLQDLGLGVCQWCESPRLWPQRVPAPVLDRTSPPSLDPPLSLPPPLPADLMWPDVGDVIGDRTPECGGEPSREGGERTPQPTPQRAKRTPKPPRRPLHWYEVPDLSAARVLRSAEDCEEGLDDRHPAAVHASRLMFHILEPGMTLDDPPITSGSVERGLFAWQAEQSYYDMCFHLWWRPHRWGGTGGVAEHFRRHLQREPRYKWCLLSKEGIEDGEQHKRVFYFMPAPALGLRLVKSAGKRTPKRAPKAPKRTPRMGFKIKRAA